MANLLRTPDDFENFLAEIPPSEFVDGNLVVDDAAWTFLIESNLVDPFPHGSIVAANGTIEHASASTLYLNVAIDDVVVQSFELLPGVVSAIALAADAGDTDNVKLVISLAADSVTPAEATDLVLSLVPTAGVSNNCSCTDVGGRAYRTLAELRGVVMSRCGFGNQIDNPPPGVAAMINSILYEAQYSLYNRFTSLRMERFFTWQLLPGVNLYGLGDTIDDCDKRLNPDKLKYVGVVREGNLWTRLIAGIPPNLNSYPNTSGYPIRYEIRQCIEVWPIPGDEAGQLVMKGIFDLLPFADDADVCSIDDSLILALAIADTKAHYRQPDAERYLQRAEVLLQSLVAGTHLTRRYIPGQRPADGLVYVQPIPTVPFPPNS